MHGLRDAPGDGTIGCHADDERALAAEEAHVDPLVLAANETRPAFCQPRRSSGNSPPATAAMAVRQWRRTLTVSRWPGRSVECRVMPFQLTQVRHRDAEHLRDARQRVAAAHLVGDLAGAAATRRWACCCCPTSRGCEPQLLARAQRVAGAHAVEARQRVHVHAMPLGDAPQRIAAAHHVHGAGDLPRRHRCRRRAPRPAGPSTVVDARRRARAARCRTTTARRVQLSSVAHHDGCVLNFAAIDATVSPSRTVCSSTRTRSSGLSSSEVALEGIRGLDAAAAGSAGRRDRWPSDGSRDSARTFPRA